MSLKILSNILKFVTNNNTCIFYQVFGRSSVRDTHLKIFHTLLYNYKISIVITEDSIITCIQVHVH